MQSVQHAIPIGLMDTYEFVNIVQHPLVLWCEGLFYGQSVQFFFQVIAVISPFVVSDVA